MGPYEYSLANDWFKFFGRLVYDITNDEVMKILAGKVELVLALYLISLVLSETASFSYIITVELISSGLYNENKFALLTFYFIDEVIHQIGLGIIMKKDR